MIFVTNNLDSVTSIFEKIKSVLAVSLKDRLNILS